MRYTLYLDHQFDTSLEYKIGQHLFHSSILRHTSRVSMDGYTVVDTRLLYRKKKFECFLEASNLWDVEYRETNLVTMPGRWIRGGLSFVFK